MLTDNRRRDDRAIGILIKLEFILKFKIGPFNRGYTIINKQFTFKIPSFSKKRR